MELLVPEMAEMPVVTPAAPAIGESPTRHSYSNGYHSNSSSRANLPEHGCGPCF